MLQELKPNSYLHDGKYRIIRKLGSGGFGITYLAEDTERKTQVAIKEYFPKIWCQRRSDSSVIVTTHEEYREMVEKGMQRFLKEAKNLNQLDNPNIVKVYSAFKENNTAYYVMEYINGETLAQKVERDGKLSVNESVKLMDVLCATMAYIHSRNMTHYDLKPQNIMIRRDGGTPVIIDFGLSKQYDSKGDATSTLLFAHSEGYSGIELYGNTVGENVFSPQTDIYSMGAILYFMLKGVRPPEASQLQESSLPSANIPKYIYDVIVKAMAFSKKDRYPNVLQFKRALDRAAKGINPFPQGEETVIGGTTTGTTIETGDWGRTGNPRGSEDPEPGPSKSGTLFKKYWWIFVLAAIVACAIIFSRTDFTKDKVDMTNITENQGQKGNMEGANPTDNPVDFNIDPTPEPEKPQIKTTASRNFSLYGYNYSEKFNLRADNGVLTVNSVRNGEKISETFNYNKTVDAEKILDQFQGMANFWAARFVAPFIINDDGFYSEQVMNSTLKFLKTAMDYMSSNKGNCPTAYSALNSWRSQFNALHKDWLKEDSPSESKWNEWENELDMLNFGMNENPVKPKDIYGL